MPLLQYFCADCNLRFDELVKNFKDPVVCPRCGKKVERSYSGEVYSATGKKTIRCSGNCKTCGGCK